jgi:nitrile hydratase
MNGIHDMGGMDGFGSIEAERDEPPFHERWEGRVLAMARAMGHTRVWNIDMGRASLEALPPETYLHASYYERWALGLENRLLAHGLVKNEELAAGHARHHGKTLDAMTPSEANRATVRGNYERVPQAPARFRIGDRVRAANINPTTHTRLPRYVRGHAGIIEAVRGCHAFPDEEALGKGGHPRWLYSVAFEARELWGEETQPGLKISIDAWEPYLVLDTNG